MRWYDLYFCKSSLTNAGISIVAAVVNGYNKDFPQLRYPGVDFNDGTQYYAFNAVTEEGINLIESCTYFLAERYNGGDKGKVVDWVIGNEVNDNLQYNYLKPREGSSYVAEYYKQFKMFYNVIKESRHLIRTVMFMSFRVELGILCQRGALNF